MRLNPIPPSYSSSQEALDRAVEEWSSREALAKLTGLLIAGKLTAWAVNHKGALTKLTSEFWTTSESHGVISYVNHRINLPPLYQVVFLTEELDDILPTMLQKIAKHREEKKNREADRTASDRPGQKNKGGRPTQHDWTAIWVEMCAYIDREGAPESYAALVDFILNSLLQKPMMRKEPSRSEVHGRAKLLIDRIRSDQGLPPIT
jgi:hypothetical protein